MECREEFRSIGGRVFQIRGKHLLFLQFLDREWTYLVLSSRSCGRRVKGNIVLKVEGFGWSFRLLTEHAVIDFELVLQR